MKSRWLLYLGFTFLILAYVQLRMGVNFPFAGMVSSSVLGWTGAALVVFHVLGQVIAGVLIFFGIVLLCVMVAGWGSNPTPPIAWLLPITLVAAGVGLLYIRKKFKDEPDYQFIEKIYKGNYSHVFDVALKETKYIEGNHFINSLFFGKKLFHQKDIGMISVTWEKRGYQERVVGGNAEKLVIESFATVRYKKAYDITVDDLANGYVKVTLKYLSTQNPRPAKKYMEELDRRLLT
ncbi:phage holin family protein [Cesiribacter sp. SM1]|uniref:phage holin family protein n=1 Tax=Cesiribacter sp. SM1 TaxID=2861196 RepID=UPI001CD6A067|nr:phage holin family protein [Cesiribacter sp. SM1]